MSGYIYDDAINSSTPGYLIQDSQTILPFTLKILNAWIHAGRFFPLAFYVYGLFNLIQDLTAYKIFLFSINLVDIVLFLYLLFLLTKDKVLVNLTFLAIPLFFSFQLGADAVLAFGGLLQLVFLYTLISLIFLKWFLDYKKTVYLVLSILFYCMGLATYEITYSFFLLHAVVILFDFKKKATWDKKNILYMIPYAGSAILVLGISLFLRRLFDVPVIDSSSTYTISINIVPILTTYAKQLVSTFPLAYRIFNPDNVFSTNFPLYVKMILLAIPAVVLFLIGLCNGKKVLTKDEKLSLQSTVLLGCLLFFLPGLLISLSPKYQAYIGWGRPYLPVYIQFFGLDLTLISIGLYCRHKLVNKLSVLDNLSYVKTIRKISIVLLATGYCFTLSSNYAVVQKSNLHYLYPRNTLELALENGLLNDIPSDSMIILDGNSAWDTTAFFLMHSGEKKLKVLTRGTYLSDNSQETQVFSSQPDSKSEYTSPFLTKHVYYLRYDSKKLGTGYAILAPLDELKVSKDSVLAAFSKNTKVFYMSPDITSNQFQVSGVSLDTTVKPFLQKGTELNTLKSKEHFVISELDNLGGMIDLSSVNVNDISSYVGKSEYWSLVPQQKLLLKNLHNPPFHVGFNKKLVPNGAEFAPIKLEDSFSIELIVKPSAEQVPYAGLIGNHPGEKDHGGFVIQQDGVLLNNYYFTFGDGEKWMDNTYFKLHTGEWNYVAVTFNKSTQDILVYVNGALVAHQVVNGHFENSQLSLFVGNWINGDRPFNGNIDEVRISNDVISFEQIQDTWLKISQEFKNY